MDLGQVQTQYYQLGKSLYQEGYVDDQFTVIQKLADDSRPDFVVEIISIFFRDTDKNLQDITSALGNPCLDFNLLLKIVQTLKGSSSSIGAKKVKNVCTTFMGHCNDKNLQGCIQCLQQVKQEYSLLRKKLETLCSLQVQILGAGGELVLID